MNGTETRRIPDFLKGEPLPAGYFEPVNPYVDAPTCNVNFGKLVAYAKAHGKTQWELTKEEVQMFVNQ
ncbi:MAG: hypothetical protein J5633_09705 [Oscillospiraceae bacterium]|nr:hypothetical protein [Oscillospiraceae bacterium]